jgi:hypothetical protein
MRRLRRSLAVGVSEPAVSATVLQKKVFDFKPAW